MSVELEALIQKGGVYTEVEGSSYIEVYRNIVDRMNFSDSISKDDVYEGLCAREKVMSTAVGNGIAIPHCRIPVIKEQSEQCVAIACLKRPLEMQSPDELPVNCMFVILASNQSDHIQILAALAELMKNSGFRKLLADHASEAEILDTIREFRNTKQLLNEPSF